ESIARRIAGKDAKPFKYKDKGTMATIGRSAAVVQMLGGRTMTGLKEQAAGGAVHLALLPTNEDRAKAVVDWAGAALTHQRAGRITVESEEALSSWPPSPRASSTLHAFSSRRLRSTTSCSCR